MTNRKPPGSDWESWVDAIIREGQERGEFDNLPGAGKPIDGLDKPHDDLWWVRRKLRDEGVSYLPPTLAVRKEKEDALLAIEALSSEPRVRDVLEQLNERIRAVNRRPGEGPPSTVMPLDVDEILAAWRQRHAQEAADVSRSPEPAATTARPAKRGWTGLRRRRRG